MVLLSNLRFSQIYTPKKKNLVIFLYLKIFLRNEIYYSFVSVRMIFTQKKTDKMNSKFKELTQTEYQLLIEAIPMIAILIAGADDEIDLQEKTWAEKIIKIRSYHNHFDLKPFYKDVDEQFKGLYEKLLSELPKKVEERSKVLSKKLSGINDIFIKLSMRTANQLYNSFIAYAEQIARASGGFLRMISVSKEESVWIGLPMIDPIFYDEIDEEE
jgi:myosin heavy subunit